ncbi:hypothetical protein LOAG_02140 [Loa loa]|uniref:Reverse transcriptase domain-containing protein n=1 Tax=Loa loa TaxID=7209 RepID=A0A1I7VK26_LOALO|nr:hypothetical protein LOAG_02140 [Loa loa]EFO26342.1 hypothetical protein LOAG_02140 [Loa loa]
MEADVDAELLKTCWAPLGFRLAGQHCAAKFHVKAGHLHTMLTDYENIYYEIADFTKKFSSLNAKLGGPEKILLEKVRNMFMSSTAKVSNENKNDTTLEFDLEIVAGKRALKWHFFGQHLGSMTYIFSHITRPLLNILSVVVGECDLSSVKVPVSGSSFSGLFGKPSVQKLYEIVATEAMVVKSIGSTCRDDENHEDINTGIDGSNHVGKNGDSLSATPPSTSIYEVVSDIDQDKFREIRLMHTSPQKKPKLRF